MAILAVTKGFGAEAIHAALTVGLSDIGENYYQEAAAKFAGVAWPPGARRHFIGRLQRNKARRIAQLFDVVQTVDRLEVARDLDAAAGAARKTLDVLVQLNVAHDERAGVSPERALDLASALRALSNVRVRGAMAIGPAKTVLTAAAFARAAACYDEMRRALPDIDTFSLGMTGDLEAAIAAGSTMVRLGTALFGPRSQEG